MSAFSDYEPPEDDGGSAFSTIITCIVGGIFVTLAVAAPDSLLLVSIIGAAVVAMIPGSP